MASLKDFEDFAANYSQPNAFDEFEKEYNLKNPPEQPKPSLSADIGRLALQGVSNVGGTVGYGLEKTGLAPEFGRKLQESDIANTQRLQANMSPEQQAANVQPFINPDYKPDTPEGSSFINPEFGFRSLAGNVVPSIPGTLAMGVLGSPLASAATKGLSLAGVGAKTAQTVGAGLGFGASEGAFSGAQNAAQWGAEQRAKPIEAFANSPQYQQALAELGDPEQAKEAVINKGQSDIFNETLIKTGGISAITGGGVFGTLKGAKATDKIIPATLKGIGSEAGQEAPQSYYEQIATNKATQEYIDPTQDITEGALNAGIVGGISGGVLGAVGGAGPLSRAAMNAARTRNERPNQNTSNTGQPVPTDDSQPANGNIVGEVGPTNTRNYQPTPTTEPLNERNRSAETDNRSTITGGRPLAGENGPFGTGQQDTGLYNPNNTGNDAGLPGQINQADQLRNLDGRNLQEEARNGSIGRQLQERNIGTEPTPTRRTDEVTALINEELARDPKAKPQDVINRVTDEVEFESKKQSALARWNEAFNSVQDEKAKKVLANDIKLLNAATPDNLDKKVEKASERANKYGVTIPEERDEAQTDSKVNEQLPQRDQDNQDRNAAPILSGTRPPLADNLTESKANEDTRTNLERSATGLPEGARGTEGTGTGIEGTPRDRTDLFTTETTGLSNEKAEESTQDAANANEEGRESLLTPTHRLNDGYDTLVKQEEDGSFTSLDGVDNYAPDEAAEPLSQQEIEAFNDKFRDIRKRETEILGSTNVERRSEGINRAISGREQDRLDKATSQSATVDEGIERSGGNFGRIERENLNDQKETQAQDQRTEGRAEIPVGRTSGRYGATQDRGTSELPGGLSESEQSTGQRADLPSAGSELSELKEDKNDYSERPRGRVQGYVQEDKGTGSGEQDSSKPFPNERGIRNNAETDNKIIETEQGINQGQNANNGMAQGKQYNYSRRDENKKPGLEQFAENYQSYSDEKKTAIKQMLQDQLATTKSAGRSYQHLVDRIGVANEIDKGNTPAADRVYANAVEGHPESNVHARLQNLIPYFVRNSEDAGRKLDYAEELFRDVAGKLAQAEYKLKQAKTAAEKKKAKAEISRLASKEFINSDMVDALRHETIPELERLYKEAKKLDNPIQGTVKEVRGYLIEKYKQEKPHNEKQQDSEKGLGISDDGSNINRSKATLPLEQVNLADNVNGSDLQNATKDLTPNPAAQPTPQEQDTLAIGTIAPSEAQAEPVRAPIPQDELVSIIKKSPQKDIGKFVNETINSYKHLLPANHTKNITSKDLAKKIAETYDLNETKNHIAYSVLTHVPDRLPERDQSADESNVSGAGSELSQLKNTDQEEDSTYRYFSMSPDDFVNELRKGKKGYEIEDAISTYKPNITADGKELIESVRKNAERIFKERALRNLNEARGKLAEESQAEQQKLFEEKQANRVQQRQEEILKQNAERESNKQKPDTKPGAYYVTAHRDGKTVVVAGPFINNHQGALDVVEKARDYVMQNSGNVADHFAAFGTSRIDESENLPQGKLNKQLGIDVATQTNQKPTTPQPTPQEQYTLAPGTIAPSEAQAEPVREVPKPYALKTGRDIFTPKEADLLIKNKGLTDYQKTEPDKNGKVQLISKPVAQIPEKAEKTESVQQDTIAKQAALKQDQSIDSNVKAQVTPKQTKAASSLRKIAESMTQSAQAEQSRDRLTNTPKRAREAGYSIEKAMKQEALAKTMMNIADAHERGETKALSQVTNKTQIEMLDTMVRRAVLARQRNQNMSYSEQQKEEGRPASKDDISFIKYPEIEIHETNLLSARNKLSQLRGGKQLARELNSRFLSQDQFNKIKKVVKDDKKLDDILGWYPISAAKEQTRLKMMGINNQTDLKNAAKEYIQFKEGKKEEDPVAKLERELAGKNVGNDYFPTPKTLAQRMAELAGVKEGSRVLEPSAGNGNLADAAKAKGAKVDTVEISPTLQDVLKAKGHNLVGTDFNEYKPTEQYDSVIMNPPFSKNQDSDHIQKAYDMVKPGGKLVAIAGEGVFFRNDKKSQSFRDWLNQTGATVEKLPQGTFQDKTLQNTTGANARLITIQKPQGQPIEQASQTEATQTAEASAATQPILTQLKTDYIKAQKKAWLSEHKNALPKVKEEAFKEIEANYETEVERAHASLPFEQYKALPDNKKFSDDVNRQVYDQLQKDYKSELGVPISGTQLNTQATENKGSSVVSESELNKNIKYSKADNKILAKEAEIKENGRVFKTGKPVTFKYVHNKESATDLFGKPKKDSKFGRYFEPSGQYVTVVGEHPTEQRSNMEYGELTLNNPLVIENDSLNWKEQLSRSFGGKRGKKLSKAIIDAGYDGIVTTDNGATSEVLNLTNFDEEKAKFSKAAPQLYSQLRKSIEAAPDRVFSTGPQTKAWLTSNAPKLNVKKDEIYWSGIEEFLDAQGKISKQDVLSYLNENGVKTEDVTLRNDKAKHNKPTLTLKGGKDYRETVVTIPTVEKFNESDSTHFGDVASGKQIAWTRSNVRTDASGKDSLFLEEIQSQRGQEGRKKGFSKSGRNLTTEEENELLSFRSIENLSQEQQDRVLELFNETKRTDGIPPSPFITDSNNKATNAYISLLLKKSVLQAIENGQDSVSWTTGTQQADRYDLSRQISRVSYDQLNNLKAYDLNNRLVMHEQVPEEQIQDHIGKEPAEKLLKTPAKEGVREIAGMDLKLGGEWADSMYGDEQGLDRNGKPSLILQAARDIAKRFGGRIESIKIDITDKDINRFYKVQELGSFETSEYFVYDLRKGEIISKGYGTKQEAQEELNNIANNEIFSTYSVQPALIITPEMKAKVTGEGLPLFSKEKAKTGSTVAELKGLLNAQDKKLVQSGKLKIVQSFNNIPGNILRTGDRLARKNSVLAWHGSPHDHDRFDSSRIGTGEGAQAFGYGHYFTNKKAIAEYYQKSLSGFSDTAIYIWRGSEYPSKGSPIAHALGLVYHDNVQTARRIGKDGVNASKKGEAWALEMGGLPYWNKMLETANSIKSKSEVKQRKGRLYQVELAPNEDELLDWDKPLSDLSEKVKNALNSLGIIETSPPQGGVAYLIKKSKFKSNVRVWNGEDLYKRISNVLNSDKKASDYLHSLGIRGIRYKAEGGKSDAYNYVIFSDEDINIKEKYSKNDLIEGFYDPKSKNVWLIADNVTKDNLRSVLDHEYLHASLAENPKLKDRLMGAHSELRDIFSKVESGEYTGKYKSLYDEALRRTDRAKTPDADRFEEWLAYQITQWQKSPSSLPQRLAKAIKDFVATIKALIYKYTGQIGQINPADLVALARSSMQLESIQQNVNSDIIVKASKQGYKGNNMSEAEEWLRAKEKGLDMSDEARMERAKAMGFNVDIRYYHGSVADIKEFDLNRQGDNTGNQGWFGSGISVTRTLEDAEKYARTGAEIYGGNSIIYPLYIRVGNTFRISDEITFDNKQKLAARLLKLKGWNKDQIDFLSLFHDVSAAEIKNKLDNIDKKITALDYKYKFVNPDDFFNERDSNKYRKLIAERKRLNAILPKPDRFENRVVSFSDFLGDRGLGGKEVTRVLLENGYNSVSVNRTGINNKKTIDSEVTLFSPNQIRSIHAAFDPDYADSPNLLASKAEQANTKYSMADDLRELLNRRTQDNENDPNVELNRRIREQHKTVSDRAKQWLKREFSPGGLLPKQVFDLKISRDSEINAEELIAHNLVATLDRNIKSAWSKEYADLTQEQKDLIDSRLKGEEVNLPDNVKDSVDAMRLHIDKLSARYAQTLAEEAQQLQEQGNDAQAATKVQLLNIISGNIGKYVNRSYRAFDDENWPRKVPDDVLNNARQYFVSRFTENGSENPTGDAQRVINDILKTGTAYDTFEQYVKESKLGAKDLSIFIKRQEIAPEIRELLGEYKDARVNFVKSATKMSRLIFNDDFLKQVKTAGLVTEENPNGFFFTEDNRPFEEHTVKIAADSSSPMAPLNGLYTYPEINKAFIDALNKESMEDWYRFIIQANGFVKYGKTVLSPTTAFRNWMSAYFFTLANGHFDLSHMKEATQSFKTYFEKDNGRLDYLAKLKRLGVVYDTPYAGEMMALLADSKFESALMGEGRGKLDKFKLNIKDFMDLATKFYQFGDDFWKIIGFENEKQMLMQYRNMTEAEAEVKAAERIRNTYPTYTMVGRAINKLRRFPLVGTFVSFPAEIIRTSFNMLKYAQEDMAYSKELGRRRIAGLSMVSGMAFAAQALAMSLSGMDDDEEEALRDLAPPWSKNSNIIPLGRDKDGSLIYLDMSFLDPYNYFKRPINAILRDQPIDEMVYEVGRELLTPFFGQDIAFGALSDIWQNKKDSGGRVFNPNDTPTNILLDMANHLRKNLQPGAFSNIERLADALTGYKSQSGRVNTVSEELAGLVGFRASRLNPKVALYYKSYEFQDKLKDASQILNDAARNPNKVSESKLESAYERARQTRLEAFEDMHELVKAAKKSGMTDGSIRNLLRLNNVSKKNISYIMVGKEPKWRPNKTFLQSSIKKSGELFDQETTKEFERRRKMILSE